MKKIFSISLLISLVLPSFVFAIEGQEGQQGIVPIRAEMPREGKPMPQEMARTLEKKALLASTTKAKILERKDDMRASLRSATSGRPLPPERQNASTTRQNNPFCSQIDKLVVALDGKVVTSDNKRSEVTTKIAEKRDEAREKVDAIRKENESKRTNQLNELSKRATTDEQKAAITTFTTAMNKALAEKNKAIDTLLLSHRKEVDQATGVRKTEVDKALATLRTDIEAAKTKAKSDCASGTDGAIVRTDLKNALQVAQEKFKGTVGEIERVKVVASSSRQIKQDELKKIEEVFKKSVEQARNDLKIALKTIKTGTSTPTGTQP